MKQLLFSILVITIISSCNQRKEEKTKSEIQSETEKELNSKVVDEKLKLKKKKDTIHNYWELILDTITEQKDFEISHKSYSLELKTYSLNDSAIVRNLSDYNSQQYLDYSHTMVTDFNLTTDSIAEHKQIDRTDFENSLFPEFYSECNLFSTAVDSIIGEIIYLTTDLAVPDSDNQWRVWYAIKVTNDRLGDLEIKDVDYVGL